MVFLKKWWQNEYAADIIPSNGSVPTWDVASQRWIPVIPGTVIPDPLPATGPFAFSGQDGSDPVSLAITAPNTQTAPIAEWERVAGDGLSLLFANPYALGITPIMAAADAAVYTDKAWIMFDLAGVNGLPQVVITKPGADPLAASFAAFYLGSDFVEHQIDYYTDAGGGVYAASVLGANHVGAYLEMGRSDLGLNMFNVQIGRDSPGDQNQMNLTGQAAQIRPLVVFTAGAGQTAPILDLVTSAAAHALRVTGDNKVGLFDAVPVGKAAAYTQTYATAARVNPNATALAVLTTASGLASFGYTQAQADSIPVAINAIEADLLAIKKLVNALIDDSQALGVAA